MKRLLASICTVALLAGCATTAIPNSDATPGTMLETPLAKSGPGTLPVIVKRDSGFVGGACSHRVSVDGGAVADLRVGQLVTIHLPPGPHMFSARSNGICGGGDAEAEVIVREGRQNAVRVSIDAGSSIRIQPTSF